MTKTPEELTEDWKAGKFQRACFTQDIIKTMTPLIFLEE